MNADWINFLRDLEADIAWAMCLDDSQIKEMTESEKLQFKNKHPNAHCRIGNFEIRCLTPEKYNLENDLD